MQELMKFVLPRIESATLKNFSLYSLKPSIKVMFDDGIFCLAGANGLGKSTFLAALNFGLTGIVPGTRFDSVDEFYETSAAISKDFFSGRIKESDRENAEIQIEMTIGSHKYSITRGMFEPNELRSLKISGVVTESAKLSGSARHLLYAKHLATDVGLESFAQFVFLQHFVFTFDERRHLLFWDEGVLERVLHLSFGLANIQATADILRREMERADSRARNAKWKATQAQARVDEIEDKLRAIQGGEKIPEDVAAEHRLLMKKVETSIALCSKLETQANDERIKLAEFSSRHSVLRAEYNDEFNRRFKSHVQIDKLPMVVNALAEHKCCLCGAVGPTVINEIEKRIHASDCPFCGSEMQSHNQSQRDLSKLKKIDQELSKIRPQIEDCVKTISRVENEISQSRVQLQSDQGKLQQFEKKHHRHLGSLKIEVDGKTDGKDSQLKALLDAFNTQVSEGLAESEEYYKTRDEKKRELRKYHKSLEEAYKFIEPEYLDSPVYFFMAIDSQYRYSHPSAVELGSVHVMAQDIRGPFVVQVLPNDRVLLCKGVLPDLSELAQIGVVYSYDSGVERIHAKAESKEIPRVCPSFPSNFSTPTFCDLLDALNHY